MSEGIKRMLAERAKLAEKRNLALEQPEDAKRSAWDDRVDETFALIERAAPFMDEDCDPNAFRPSDRLKLVYCLVATAPDNHPDKAFAAHKFIHDMLAKARELWVNGYHPDPWREIPVPREAV